MALSVPTVHGQLAGVTASADLSSKQYYNVVQDAATTCAIAGADVQTLGVLINEPESGEGADVVLFGTAKMIVDGNAAGIAVSDFLMTDANGKGVLCNGDTENIVGQALAASTADGDIIPVIVLSGTFAG